MSLMVFGDDLNDIKVVGIFPGRLLTSLPPGAIAILLKLAFK